MGFGAAHGNEDLPRGAMGAVLYLEKFWISVPWLTSAMVDHLNSCWVSSCLRSPPDSVFKLSCLSVRLIRYCYQNISWTAWIILIKLAGNIHQPILMTWLDSGGQRSRSRQAVGVKSCERGISWITWAVMNYFSSLYTTQLYCNIFAAEQLNC